MKSARMHVAFWMTAVFALVSSNAVRANPPGFGKSSEEVVKLASKEGNVRIGMGFSDEKSMERVMAGFFKKYLQIKVEYGNSERGEGRLGCWECPIFATFQYSKYL